MAESKPFLIFGVDRRFIPERHRLHDRKTSHLGRWKLKYRYGSFLRSIAASRRDGTRWPISNVWRRQGCEPGGRGSSGGRGGHVSGRLWRRHIWDRRKRTSFEGGNQRGLLSV